MTDLRARAALLGKLRSRHGTKENVMPKQKDLKRIVRSRKEKTGESYTAARAQVLRKKESAPDYAQVAGRSDAVVTKQTGRDWAEWVRILDAQNANEMPHGEIARYVVSLGTPSWWSQTVTVGYERIRGLRDRGQRRDGAYEANKSRTLQVGISRLYDAFANARVRRRWLPDTVEVRSARPNKRMSMKMPDGTAVEIGFSAKGAAKSAVALTHTKLTSRSASDEKKAWWAERFDALAEFLT
ncbi:MAG: hypothetical protein ABR525_08960 [Candidatus Limnocylindria bacterium]